LDAGIDAFSAISKYIFLLFCPFHSMRTFALVLACFAFTGHARRVQDMQGGDGIENGAAKLTARESELQNLARRRMGKMSNRPPLGAGRSKDGGTNDSNSDRPYRKDSEKACPYGGLREGCGDQRCCWQLQNKRIRAAFTDDPWPQWYSFEDLEGAAEAVLPVGGSPFFLLLPQESLSKSSGASRVSDAPRGGTECSLQNVTRIGQQMLHFVTHCGEAITAEFSAELPTADAHYIRIRVKIWSRPSSEHWPAVGFRALRLFVLRGMVKAVQTRNLEARHDALDGLPLLINDHFFVGVEHPMARLRTLEGSLPDIDRWSGVVGDIAHTTNLPRPIDSPWEYGAVFGAYSEPSQARRAFVTYLENERPGRRSPMVHYNSWYDFYSYQDEGFNGGFNDREPNKPLIQKLRLDRMGEEGCLQRVEAFGTALVQNRSITIDSFLWDDGWDDPQTLWQFDKERFPQGFDRVALKAKSFGVGTGVWLSPWGGYGFPQEARVNYGKKYGYETNLNELLGTEAFSLAGPKYRKVFTDVALKFVAEHEVNMFKFDGVAGDPHELAVEMEAMLGLITDLRRQTRLRHNVQLGESNSMDTSIGVAHETVKNRNKEKDDDIWINLTTGTWASPFFLFWADSIWRGGPDIATRWREWVPDIKYWRGHEDMRKLPDDGLTSRQRWIRWRTCIVYIQVVQQSHFFPISQLMIHGVIVASHGDAFHWGLMKYDAIDFAQEVWSFVGLGLQLQELYVAPRYMTAEAWDILAEGLRWARLEAAVLRDSHWAFGDPTERKVYCVASWDVASARGFAFLHNPTGEGQLSQSFRLDAVLELPARQRDFQLSVEVIKSIARRDNRSDSPHRFPGWNCDPFGPGVCSISAIQEVTVQMLRSEVLILGFTGVALDRAKVS